MNVTSPNIYNENSDIVTIDMRRFACENAILEWKINHLIQSRVDAFECWKSEDWAKVGLTGWSC